jgi:5-methylcytosine-specific restriction endonuclease McrA
MKNPRITKKELGLLKGSIRRTFARSELRERVIEASVMKGYSDPKRKRVKYWIKCTICGNPEAKSNIQLDHVHPVIPIDSSFEEMSIDDVVNRQWCEEENLKPVCKPCHEIKTKAENKERRRIKKLKGT